MLTAGVAALWLLVVLGFASLLLAVFLVRKAWEIFLRFVAWSKERPAGTSGAFGAGLGTAVGNGSVRSFLVFAGIYYGARYLMGKRRARVAEVPAATKPDPVAWRRFGGR